MVGVPQRASVGAGGPAGAEGKDTQRNAAHSTHFAAYRKFLLNGAASEFYSTVTYLGCCENLDVCKGNQIA